MVEFIIQIIAQIRDNQALKTTAISALVAFFSITGTYAVLDKTIMGALRDRLDNLDSERKGLLDENKELQSRAERSQANAAEDLKEKTNLLSKFYESEVSQVTHNYLLFLKENESLKNEITRLREDKVQYSAAATDKYLSALEKKSVQIRDEISESYQQLENKSTEFGFAKSQCEGEGKEIFINVCARASQYESEMKTLRDRIGSLEKYSQNINDQIISFHGNK